MADVRSTTTNLGLVKFTRGHPVRDIVIGSNMELIDAAYQGGVKVVKGDLADGNTGTYAFTWQNPESTAILVQRVIIDVTTQATAAAEVDIDVVASATDTGTGIFDTLLVNSAVVTDHLLVTTAGAGGVHRMDEPGGTNAWITGKIKTASAADLVGKYYIQYVVV